MKTSLTTGEWGSFTAPRSRALGGKSGMTRAKPLVLLFNARQRRTTSTPDPGRSRLHLLPPTPETLPGFLALILYLILSALGNTWVAWNSPQGPSPYAWTVTEEGCGPAVRLRARDEHGCAPPAR
jgi:hypothetical protein